MAEVGTPRAGAETAADDGDRDICSGIVDRHGIRSVVEGG